MLRGPDQAVGNTGPAGERARNSGDLPEPSILCKGFESWMSPTSALGVRQTSNVLATNRTRCVKAVLPVVLHNPPMYAMQWLWVTASINSTESGQDIGERLKR